MYWKSSSFRSRRHFIEALKDPQYWVMLGISTILAYGCSKVGFSNDSIRKQNYKDEMEILTGIE